MAGVASGLKDKLKIRNVRYFTSTGNVSMENEGALVINKTVAAATTVTLPPHPEVGDVVYVVDGKGDASSFNITVQGYSTDVINGSTSTIATDYMCKQYMWNGVQWNIVCAS